MCVPVVLNTMARHCIVYSLYSTTMQYPCRSLMTTGCISLGESAGHGVGWMLTSIIERKRLNVNNTA